MALSDHVPGAGVCGARGISRPISSNRPRTNRAPQAEDVLSHAPPPIPAASPVATNVRRSSNRRFKVILSCDLNNHYGGQNQGFRRRIPAPPRLPADSGERRCAEFLLSLCL